MPINGNVQGRVGWDFEQPGQDGERCPYTWEGVLLWVILKGPFQTEPFCDSMMQ